ncbi:hypothetical protein OH799_03850 [Nocardia sp. NBC_00881]|uniref:hypothetical protein n=1 Tax=Nocardia sp. NBC_00881 TaxID=2975995 RepID=UPI0038654BBB|nr:hypothetical protein OH799_03850 [Nocardia sp. NBC_00881]
MPDTDAFNLAALQRHGDRLLPLLDQNLTQLDPGSSFRRRLGVVSGQVGADVPRAHHLTSAVVQGDGGDIDSVPGRLLAVPGSHPGTDHRLILDALLDATAQLKAELRERLRT